MKEHGYKDNISFDASRQHTGATAGDDALKVTEEDVNRALSRLQARVEGEAIPRMWMSYITAVGNLSEDNMQQEPTPLPLVSVNSASTIIEMPKQGDAEESTRYGNQRGNQRRKAERKSWRKVGWSTAVAAVVVGMLASPLGTKAMAAAMQTFYFHNLVGVSQSDVSQIEQALQSSGIQHINLKQYGSVEVNTSTSGGYQSVSLAKADALMGRKIAVLPGFDAKHDLVNYQPGNEVTFRLKVNAINGLLAQLGGKDKFPASVNGQPIVVQIPAQVTEDTFQNPKQQMSLTVRNMPSVQVPGNVDMNQVRKALVGLPFLPSDIAQSLATSSNWQETLYVPVGGKVTNLTVNGYSAVLQNMPGGQQRSILWLENGVLYQLDGPPTTFPTDASIIAAAKELSK